MKKVKEATENSRFVPVVMEPIKAEKETFSPRQKALCEHLERQKKALRRDRERMKAMGKLW